ncbi:hypothetical protein CAAN1_18S03070 [[Candida] anglica]|uniref:Uncharacterized protein n=1 Tax=[Candida] anglica TaxID=148631 RepID=A0ABP0EN61_9ASCO
MVHDTLSLFSQRLLNLELKAGTRVEEDVQRQLVHLRKLIDDAYTDNPELKTLNRIISDLNMWKSFDDNIPKDNQDGKDSGVSIESKEALILSKYPVLQDAYNNLAKLSTMDIPKLVNYIETSQDKTHDLFNDLCIMSERKVSVEAIAQNFHILVVKNMIVLEKYIALMQRENEFWATVETRLTLLNQKILKSEESKRIMNKY